MSLWQFIKSAPWTCGIAAFVLLAGVVGVIVAIALKGKE